MEQNSIPSIKVEDGKYGRRASATSAWSDKLTDFLIDSGIVELELNYTKGWRGDNIVFLDCLQQLLSFTILDWKIASVQPVHFLYQLRELRVLTTCRTEINFSSFPMLEKCSLEWRPKAKSLFDCVSIKNLFIDHYKAADTDSFSKLSNLESLAILNAPVKSLEGLGSLKNLKSLRLGGLRCLTSLAGIENLTNLEKLEIQTCRGIGSIDELQAIMTKKCAKWQAHQKN